MKMTAGPEVKRERRDRVTDAGLIGVEVTRSDGETLAAHVLDLTRNGTKLAVENTLQFAENVRLRFFISELDADITVEAEVRWIRHDNARWTAGFQIQQQFSDETLNSLASSGLLERRNSSRKPLSRQASIKRTGEAKQIRFN